MAIAAELGRVRSQRYDLARRCEEGIGVRCNCRCRGEKHGAHRVHFASDPIGLSRLSPSDPHHVPASRHPKLARDTARILQEPAHV